MEKECNNTHYSIKYYLVGRPMTYPQKDSKEIKQP